MIYYMRVNLRDVDQENLTLFAFRSNRDERLTHLGVPAAGIGADYDDTGSWTGYNTVWTDDFTITREPTITVEWGQGDSSEALLHDLQEDSDD